MSTITAPDRMMRQAALDKAVPHLVILEHHRKANAAGEGIIQRNTCPTKESR